VWPKWHPADTQLTPNDTKHIKTMFECHFEVIGCVLTPFSVILRKSTHITESLAKKAQNLDLIGKKWTGLNALQYCPELLRFFWPAKISAGLANSGCEKFFLHRPKIGPKSKIFKWPQNNPKPSQMVQKDVLTCFKVFLGHLVSFWSALDTFENFRYFHCISLC